MSGDDLALLHDYLEERFGRVHDRLEGIHREVQDFNTRVTRMEGSVDDINGRLWTVGAISAAIGAFLAWVQIKLGIGGVIRKG